MMRYGFACAAVAVAFALTWSIPVLRRQTPALLLFMAAVAAGWYGGLRPGLFAVCLAVLGLDRLLPPLVEVFPGFGVVLRTALFAVGLLLILSLKERSKRAERLQRATEEHCRAITETAPDILFTCAPDGACDYVNKRFYDVTGRPAGSGLGDGWAAALHPDDVGPAQQRWEKHGTLPIPFEGEYRLRVADGGYRWFMVRSRPVCDPAGRIVRWYGACTDIDDQKRAQQALAEADRRKDEFLAMLGHELRNPLNPVRSAVQVLRLKCKGDEEVEHMTSVLGRQIDHMARLIDDLLDVSRISQGKIELRRGPIDMREVVNRAVEEARPAAEERRHRLEVHLPAGPLPLEGDPDRLQQVVTNLMSNATRYTPPRGAIRASLGVEEGQGVLRVKDNGIGIRPEMLPRIFEVFQQADRVAGQVSEGLGLGLTLVQRLVAMHGGRVEAHSAGPGLGSEFIVRLPLSGGGEIDIERARREAKAELPPKRSLRILVVDDNRDGAESLALLLRLGEGHQTRVAHDGLQALEAAGEFRPEVVLLDISLPGGMDGYEVARRLRATPETAGALFVALTGFGREEDRRRSREVGFHAHLVKPVDPDLLRGVLQQYRPASGGTGVPPVCAIP